MVQAMDKAERRKRWNTGIIPNRTRTRRYGIGPKLAQKKGRAALSARLVGWVSLRR
uniref:Uncharacterized protein n=1 Tax=Aureimonas frigidaquae TaxID=424757 RepID=A0A0P0Z270_9HYPH|nr:hypothetical protein [Aureimonas frigidaquae]